MIYSVERLKSDVSARLGEIARPQGRLSESSVPWPEEIVALRAVSLLAECGSRLLREAPLVSLAGGADVSSECELRMRVMPCGLYAAEVRLPGGFLRLESVRMSEWRRSVFTPVLPDSPKWSRQWSAEPGIAGCPGAPEVYVDSDGKGMLLRLVGSGSSDDSLAHLAVWRVPEPDEEGKFDFPESLYADLVADISGRLV